MNNKSYKYPLLNDKEWLFQKYMKEGLGTRKMCKLAGAKTANSVRQALIRHSIPVRTIGDGLRHNNSDGIVINQSVIDGCLLGDGFLFKWNKSSDNSFPYFSKRNKYYDHIKYVSEILFGDRWEERVKENNEKSLGKRQIIFTLRSLSNKKLLPFYTRWYPEWNNCKKIIPEDIEITSDLLLHWFLDDGSSYLRKRKTRQVVITLCSECFSKDNQEIIIEKANSKFDLSMRLNKANSGIGYRIVIPQSKVDNFYNIIGDCPVSSMEYKWK